MTLELLTVVPNPGPLRACSWRYLLIRMHTLDLQEQDVRACTTMAALQRLATQRYRILARKFHPDTRPQYAKRNTRPEPGQSLQFQRITKTYHWLMAFDPQLVIHSPCWNPLPEAPLPFDWGWQRDLGFGWQYYYY